MSVVHAEYSIDNYTVLTTTVTSFNSTAKKTLIHSKDISMGINPAMSSGAFGLLSQIPLALLGQMHEDKLCLACPIFENLARPHSVVHCVPRGMQQQPVQ